MVAIKFLLTMSAFVTHAVAYEKWLAAIPNGASIGKPLGHEGDSGYTAFGKAFSSAGGEWAKVCSQNWPGASVTVGVALGDCKCTWTSGDPQVKLSAPDTTGEKCKALDTAPTTAPSPAAAPTTAPNSYTPTVTPAPSNSPTPAPSDSYTTPTDAPAPTPAPTPAASNTHDLCV